MKSFKQLITVIILLLAQISASNCQTLPDPVFSYLPCYLSPGVTDTGSVFPVPGATAYIWTIDSNSINAVLYNGGISPQQTTSTSMGITCVLARPFYVVCVTAISPCCTSATVCDTIWGVPQLNFDPNNDSIVAPNTSSLYSVFLTCSATFNNTILLWSITGDAGINGTGNSSATTSINTPFINLNFGPNFTTGQLCVYAVTNFGLPTDTICMTINATTSIDELNESGLQAYYSTTEQAIVLNSQFLNTDQNINYIIYDSKGSIVLFGEHSINKNESFLIPFRNHSSGIYVVNVSNDKYSLVKKIGIY